MTTDCLALILYIQRRDFLFFLFYVGCQASASVNEAVRKLTKSMKNKAAEEPHMEECLELDVLLMGSPGQFCCTRLGWESYLSESYRTHARTRTHVGTV